MNKKYDFNKPLDNDGNIDGNKISNFDEKALIRRNFRLEKYFKDAKIPVRLIGDPHKPAVIADEAVCLSAYVSNFNLHFTDRPFEGEIIYTVKLCNDTIPDIGTLYRTLICSEHKDVFRLNYDNTDLFLAGYNFTDKNNSVGKYPVFSRINPKIYFSQEFAGKVIKEFEGIYNLACVGKNIEFTSMYSELKNGIRKIHK